jgi:FkbM family methyltransferase
MDDFPERRMIRRFARFVRYHLGRFRSPYVILEVGSCNGRQFLNRCQTDGSVVVYAFEPEPESFKVVLRNTRGLSNFRAFQLAVSNVDGWREFGVSSVPGNHSFYEFVEGVNDIWKIPYAGKIPSWVPDFREDKRIKVETVRLDTFIKKMQIPYVSYLHIDAQGEDLNVLRSLGDQIGMVRAGVIEVCLKPLYKNHFTKEEALDFLEEHGFAIKRVEAEHFGLVENVYFERR